MGIKNIIYLFGGLGLFLFGMKYMSEAINQVAGNTWWATTHGVAKVGHN